MTVQPASFFSTRPRHSHILWPDNHLRKPKKVACPLFCLFCPGSWAGWPASLGPAELFRVVFICVQSRCRRNYTRSRALGQGTSPRWPPEGGLDAACHVRLDAAAGYLAVVWLAEGDGGVGGGFPCCPVTSTTQCMHRQWIATHTLRPQAVRGWTSFSIVCRNTPARRL